MNNDITQIINEIGSNIKNIKNFNQSLDIFDKLFPNDISSNLLTNLDGKHDNLDMYIILNLGENFYNEVDKNFIKGIKEYILNNKIDVLKIDLDKYIENLLKNNENLFNVLNGNEIIEVGNYSNLYGLGGDSEDSIVIKNKTNKKDFYNLCISGIIENFINNLSYVKYYILIKISQLLNSGEKNINIIKEKVFIELNNLLG